MDDELDDSCLLLCRKGEITDLKKFIQLFTECPLSTIGVVLLPSSKLATIEELRELITRQLVDYESKFSMEGLYKRVPLKFLVCSPRDERSVFNGVNLGDGDEFDPLIYRPIEDDDYDESGFENTFLRKDLSDVQDLIRPYPLLMGQLQKDIIAVCV